VTLPLDLDALADNLAKTYLAIAHGLPATKSVSGNGFFGVINPFEHPICNFAICSNSDAIEGDKLYDLAKERKHFNVYVCHPVQSSSADPTLLASGFAKRYALSQMAGKMGSPGPTIDLRAAPLKADRLKLAQFMALQFFSGQPQHIQDMIAKSSAEPSELSLFEAVSHEVRRGPLGAVMLHRTPNVMGLYNLCVALPYRSRGFGAAIVRSVQKMALDLGFTVGLQCDSQLENWYAQFGMERAGIVSVFGLERR